MLGTRGCRLGLLYPEIYEMQVGAIVGRRSPSRRAPTRCRSWRSCTRSSASQRSSGGYAETTLDTAASSESGRSIAYVVGTMIELPRACVRADEEIAGEADFFSFGTNDLRSGQTALGFSRDDAEGKFLTRYLDDGILAANPFETLDVSGVGDLMRIAVESARAARSRRSSSASAASTAAILARSRSC